MHAPLVGGRGKKKRTSNAQQMAPLDFMSLQIYRLSDVCKLIKLENWQKDQKTNVDDLQIGVHCNSALFSYTYKINN